MPSLPGVHLFRRTFILVCALLSFLLPLLNTCAFAAPDPEDGDFMRQEDYQLLQSGKRVWREKDYVKPEQPTVYLTFDDGPSKLTDGVLDILKEENVPATFFVVGEQVKLHPVQVRRAVEEGHAIGNHTYNHKYDELYNRVESFWEQIGQTEEALDEAAGIRPRLVRAPGGTFGNFDAFYFYYLDQAGYEVYDWNVDSGDSKRVGVPASEILQTVESSPLKDQVIVLMHDGTGHDQTVKALPGIIRFFKEKGYAFAPLSPQVEPVHFSPGKPKQARPVHAPTHQKLLAEAERHRLNLEERESRELAGRAPGADKTALALKEVEGNGRDASAAGTPAGVRAGQPIPTTPLKLALGSGQLLLQPAEYRLAEGSYEVPLRKLVEGMGGRVEWDESRRTAAAHYGPRTAEYDFSRCELRIRDAGITKTYHLPPMELRGGTLFVPLRATLEQLGSRITGYGADSAAAWAEANLAGGFMIF